MTKADNKTNLTKRESYCSKQAIHGVMIGKRLASILWGKSVGHRWCLPIKVQLCKVWSLQYQQDKLNIANTKVLAVGIVKLGTDTNPWTNPKILPKASLKFRRTKQSAIKQRTYLMGYIIYTHIHEWPMIMSNYLPKNFPNTHSSTPVMAWENSQWQLPIQILPMKCCQVQCTLYQLDQRHIFAWTLFQSSVTTRLWRGTTLDNCPFRLPRNRGLVDRRLTRRTLGSMQLVH